MEELDNILNLITGNLKNAEKKEILHTINSDAEKKELYKKAKYSWALISSGKRMPDAQFEESYRSLHQKISPTKSSINIYNGLKYAAIIAVLFALSALMHYMGKKSESGGPLQYTSVFADYGQISKVILPDSTVVWLNSGSTLKYNNKFSVNNRDLELIGQAYLNVHKNKSLPLFVACNKLKVKVLGTKFDVEAYPGDATIRVVLEEGSIELQQSGKEHHRYELKPGEKAVYNLESQKLDVTKTEPSRYSNWKDGLLIFQDENMAEVLHKLERKYGIKVEVLNPRVYNSVFNAKFKNESLEKIVDLMKFSCHIDAELIRENGITTKLILK